MSWWGKLLGGAFGFMLGGPLGALIGAAFGHNFDKGMGRIGEGFAPGAQERVQTVFFTTVFSVMGHLAKADGKVSKSEIDLARQIMQQFNLDDERRKVAINLFNQGKQPDFPLEDVLRQFRQECHGRRNLMQMFVEILMHAAYADGDLHASERQLLEQVRVSLGFTQQAFQHIEAMVRNAQHFASGGVSPGDVLREAYEVLGVDESASDAEVKKAYRRLMNQHHPDKLVSKGLPEEMIKLATEKSQEIRRAYDTIRKARRS
ncbi:DnaJ like chaperone protein [Thiogranum longum]|uniref:Co-chaperone protein DjlA n=1 Tax=Thiogranum longum TaxID=1537524 RepID=A0A4V2PGK5_9GAMM|nr:co-chaperone DjlA [Thiogranum longum]TCK17196.1 DnaJ like chaperone protein [Thiogranum longum]